MRFWFMWWNCLLMMISPKLMKNGGAREMTKHENFAQNVVTLMDGKIFWYLIMSRALFLYEENICVSIFGHHPFSSSSNWISISIFLYCCCCPSTITTQTHMLHLSLGSSVKLSICYLWCLSLDFLFFDDKFSP